MSIHFPLLLESQEDLFWTPILLLGHWLFSKVLWPFFQELFHQIYDCWLTIPLFSEWQTIFVFWWCHWSLSNRWRGEHSTPSWFLLHSLWYILSIFQEAFCNLYWSLASWNSQGQDCRHRSWDTKLFFFAFTLNRETITFEFVHETSSKAFNLLCWCDSKKGNLCKAFLFELSEANSSNNLSSIF